MKPAINTILTQLLYQDITVYAHGLKAKGQLFHINMDLRVIGLRTQDSELLIDIKSITTIEAEDIGAYL